MNPRDPLTWRELSSHPFFRGRFDPAWYDGDPVGDLRMLREAASMLLAALPAYSCELVALDDATIYVRVSQGLSQVADICPSRTAEGKPCYFVDLVGCQDELTFESAAEVLGLLCGRR